MDLYLIAAISLEALVPVAVFGAIAAVSWFVLDTVTARDARTNERLEEFKNPTMRRRNGEGSGPAVKKNDLFTALLEKHSTALSKPLTPKTEKESASLKQRLSVSGYRGENAASMFLSMKFALLVTGFFLSSGMMLFSKGFTQDALMGTVSVAGIAFYLPDMIVWWMGRTRKEAIFLGLPDALDLLVVCVESGLGLDQAMRKVSDEMKTSQPVICDEFAVCNMHLQMGKQRSDVLHDLGYRTGVDDLRALAAILIQADKFGSSVAQALRVQSESMRTRRRQIAEEKAAKTAVKLIFPLVLFIFPGIFVVLVGPAAITMVRQMFPAMGG